MVLVNVSLRDRQDPHTGRMDSPMVNVQIAAADQEVLSLQASLHHVSFPLKSKKQNNYFLMDGYILILTAESFVGVNRGRISSQTILLKVL